MAAIDTLEEPVKQLVERGTRSLERVFARTAPSKLEPVQTSTNEFTFLVEAARAALETLGVAVDPTEKRLHQARLRGLAHIAELRRRAEPCLETGEVCELLGVSRETIRKKVERKQLLALPKGGDRVFPAMQFEDGDVLPGLSEVLGALEVTSPFVALSFLLSKGPEFGNETAIEALRAGNLERVVAAAESFLKHGG